MEKTIVGKCPLCGSDVVKTGTGYKCEKFTLQNAECTFYASGLIGNRRMSDAEISELLANKEILLDGFSSREGKVFSTVLKVAQDGEIDMNAIVATCPSCGGDIRVYSRAFGCSNYNNQESPCTFTIWRNIGGHDVSLAEVREICQNGSTSEEKVFYLDNGTPYAKRLGLSEDKKKVEKL